MAEILLIQDPEDNVALVVLALREAEFTVSWSREWMSDAQIRERVYEASAVVVCWSPRSAVSARVLAVADRAHRAGKLVSANVEAAKLPRRYRGTRVVDLTAWQGGAGQRQFHRLAELLDQMRHESRSRSAPKSGPGCGILAVFVVALAAGVAIAGGWSLDLPGGDSPDRDRSAPSSDRGPPLSDEMVRQRVFEDDRVRWCLQSHDLVPHVGAPRTSARVVVKRNGTTTATVEAAEPSTKRCLERALSGLSFRANPGTTVHVVF